MHLDWDVSQSRGIHCYGQARGEQGEEEGRQSDASESDDPEQKARDEAYHHQQYLACLIDL